MNWLLRKLDELGFNPLLFKLTENMVDQDKRIAILPGTPVKSDDLHVNLLALFLLPLFTP